MPRMIARVVCTFGLTIVTLLPTMRIDEGRFADIRRTDDGDEAAALPGRRGEARHVGFVHVASCRLMSARGFHAFTGQHGGGRGLFGGALGAPDTFRRRRGPAIQTATRNSGS